jgi:hypothetical protein
MVQTPADPEEAGFVSTFEGSRLDPGSTNGSCFSSDRVLLLAGISIQVLLVVFQNDFEGP